VKHNQNEDSIMRDE